MTSNLVYKPKVNEFLFVSLLLISLALLCSLNSIVTLIFIIIAYLLAFLIWKTEYAFLFILFFLFLQPALFYNGVELGLPGYFIESLMRTDEFIWFAFLVIILLRKLNKTNWEINNTVLDKYGLAVVIVGLISAVINKISIFWSIIAIILTVKGIIIYWIALNISLSEKSISNYFTYIFYFLILCFIIGFMQYLGFYIPLLPSSSRFGINTAQSIFGHHGVFAFVMAVAYSLSIGVYFATREKKWLIIPFIFILGIIITSARRCFIGVSIGTLLLLLNYKKYKINKSDIKLFLVVIVIITIIFSGRLLTIAKFSKFEYTTNIDQAPRYLLYMGAIKIFQEKPLLGEGPGTYGSYISTVTKSKVYDKLGINFWGSFYTDTYWPYILGEYGVIGALLILLILIILFKRILYINSLNYKNKFIRGLSLGYFILFINYLLESSTSQVYCSSLSAFILFGGFGILESLIIKNSNKSLS